jgi:periplasmic protein TonB
MKHPLLQTPCVSHYKSDYHRSPYFFGFFILLGHFFFLWYSGFSIAPTSNSNTPTATKPITLRQAKLVLPATQTTLPPPKPRPIHKTTPTKAPIPKVASPLPPIHTQNTIDLTADASLPPTNAGSSNPLTTPTPSPSTHQAPVVTPINADSLQSIKQKYLDGLLHTIEQQKKYPALARRLKQQGKVVIRFSIISNGKIITPTIAHKSQFNSLNQAALQTVQSLQQYHPIPIELNIDKWDIELPVSFTLN